MTYKEGVGAARAKYTDYVSERIGNDVVYGRFWLPSKKWFLPVRGHFQTIFFKISVIMRLNLGPPLSVMAKVADSHTRT